MLPSVDLDELTERQRLFIASHSWALETAGPLTVASVTARPTGHRAVRDGCGPGRHEAARHPGPLG